MATDASIAAEYAWSEDVLRFAAEQGVERQLPSVLEFTQRVFPDAERLEVAVEEDPEIADDRHIVVAVALPLMDVPEVVRRNDQWHDGLIRCCPAHLLCVFRLSFLAKS